ncbi:MAG: tyrosine-type recombinase/integrase [Actinomycetales bacterium]
MGELATTPSSTHRSRPGGPTRWRAHRSDGTARHELGRIITKLELPQLTRHGLTGATWMADSGIPLHVLQKILGHKSIETTEGYLHPDLRHIS